MRESLSSYHAGLFRWHCRQFYDFERAFSRLEQKYLRKCWSLAKDFQEVSEGGYRHFSYYTYSHRVKGSSTNSSRIAYGSVREPERAYRAAEPVLKERGIELPESLTRHTRFYGLGWDFEEGDFKVYYRTLDWTALEPDFLRLAEGYDPTRHRPEALLSLTYAGTSEMERKLYLYPIEEDLPPGVQSFARMITDRRGEVSQHDVDPKKVEQQRYNTTGQRIITLYQEIGETLDTVAYQSEDEFTLYFP